MVSLWPWKGDDSSTAYFEKTLSTLNSKLSKANAHDTSLRTRSRRFKALWTLYTSLIYILCTLILVLVTGYKQWGPVEYGALVGGPIVIYTVRTALSTYYDYRISTNRAYITSIEAQRRQAINKFKQATKYDSTQQLLEKYGAEEGKASKTSTPKDSSKTKKSRDSSGALTPGQAQPARTGIAPPATANIRQPIDTSTPNRSPAQAPNASSPNTPASTLSATASSPISADTTAEFAPNADATPPQYISRSADAGARWYDRIMDLMLGEDETKPMNRLALICSHCHLVNGQAPPGTKTLGDVGRWKCFSCRAWNGEEAEVKRMISAAGEGAGAQSVPTSPLADRQGEEQDMAEVRRSSQDDEDRHGDDEAMDSEAADDAPPAKSTRSQASKAQTTT